MPFDPEKFGRAELKPRTARVDVPALAPFFDEGEVPVWQVRGLTAAELHKAMEAAKRQSNIEAVVRAIASGGDQAVAVRKALGLSADTPGEIAKRMEMLVSGSVSPAVDLPTVVKLAEHFPIEFLQLTNEITELTGKGSDLGKPEAVSPEMTA